MISTTKCSKELDGDLPNSAEIVLKEESYLIFGAIFEVHKEPGSGFLEAVSLEFLAKEFTGQKIPFTARPELTILDKDEPIEQTYKPNFIRYDKIIVEFKAVNELSQIHKAQQLNYLKITGMEPGVLVNFGSYPKIQTERLTL
ncbi:MAG TPA: GxxExxY protein [Candidatus Cloacimonadota bacterium]|mgnify:CR=1 FL=1|nr:GxxExxY protein [Candidatus Cloacimonadota bacterium]HQL15564.1 GxxExxY protein [Candidatus Cloacimonadota bacterium]